LIIRIPGVKEKRIFYPVASIDIFPTIAELIGEMTFQGYAITRESLFRNEKLQRDIFSEHLKRASLFLGKFRLFRNEKGVMNYTI